MPITPSYYNTVVRQDNEIDYSSGSQGLKTQRYILSELSYTWMPSTVLSLFASLRWQGIVNDIVPHYQAVDNKMIHSMTNDGNYNEYEASLSPSVRLFKGKLQLQPMLYFAYETHTGVVDIRQHNLMFYPTVIYNVTNELSVSLRGSARIGNSKGYMRGSSNLTAFGDNWNCSLQYVKGRWYLAAFANCIFRKLGYTRSWFDAPNFHSYTWASSPQASRFFRFTVRYSFDFGKKIIQHNGTTTYEGTTKPAVL